MGISKTEYERRYAAIRAQMKKDGLDSILVAGLPDDFNRGNIRYITGNGRGGYCIFPVEGKPVLLSSSLLANSPKAPKPMEAYDLLTIRETMDTPNQVVKELKALNRGGSIGLVGINCISIPAYLALKEAFGDKIVEVNTYFRPFREIKSAEEIEKLRTSAAIADKVYRRLREIIRPGLSEYAIYGEVKKIIYGEGCEYSFDLLDAAGSMMNMAFYPTTDALEENGTLFMEISPSYQGYYVQLPVTLPVVKYSDQVLQMVKAWNYSDTNVHPMLKPGTKVIDIYHKLVGAIEEKGFKSPLRPGHSVGLDILDFWSVDDTEPDAVLKAGMVIAIHPCSITKLGGDGVGMGYTYLITESGYERFSKINLAEELIG